MQGWDSNPQPYYITPVKPGAEARYRRWDLAIILILAVLVVGVFVGLLPPPPSPSTVHHQAPGKIHEAPAAHTSS